MYLNLCICEKYVRIIAETNKNNTTRIKAEKILTEAVPIIINIKQRNSLSPVLFNLIMNEIIKNAKDIKIGYNMGNNIIQILCCADNATLFTENENDFQTVGMRVLSCAIGLC